MIRKQLSAADRLVQGIAHGFGFVVGGWFALCAIEFVLKVLAQ